MNITVVNHPLVQHKLGLLREGEVVARQHVAVKSESELHGCVLPLILCSIAA